MEQVILDHVYYEPCTDERGCIRLGFREQGRLNSLFGKYPNFVFVENGIKSNHSSYISQLTLNGYDGVKQRNFLTHVDDYPIGIKAIYRVGENEPRQIIFRGNDGLIKKRIINSDSKKIINLFDNYGNIMSSKVL